MNHDGNGKPDRRYRDGSARFGARSVARFALCVVLAGCARTTADIEASGTIEATEVRVAAATQGRVVFVGPDEGASVRRGDVLVRLEHESLDIQQAQARAGVALARSQLDLLLGGARSEDLAQARAALEQAAESFRLAEADAARTKELAASGSATPRQLDDAAARLAIARAQSESATQALKKLERFARPEDLRAAQARLDQAEWSARLIEKMIRDCDVTAPIDGVVANRLLEVGETAAPGMGVALLVDLSRLSLTLYVPEAQLGKVSLGALARVAVDSFPETWFEGRVAYISPKAEFTPKNVQTKDERVKQVFAVRLDLGDGRGMLKPGMPADARFGQ